MHGGSIGAFSEGPGKGSEFVVRLPALPQETTGESGSAHETEGPGVPPLRLLIVDDSVDAARSLGLLLGRSGHKVHIAHDGPTALGLVREHPLDVVLLDIGLPGMNGYEVARRIKAERPLPIIAMTGYTRESDAPSDFDEYLVKPVDPEALLGLLSCFKPSSGGV